MAKYKIYKNKRTNYHPAIQIAEDYKNKTRTNFHLTHSPNRNTFVPLPSKLNKKDEKVRYISKKYYIDPLRYRGNEVKKYEIDRENLKLLEELISKNKKSGVVLKCTTLTKNVRQSPTKKIKSNKN